MPIFCDLFIFTLIVVVRRSKSVVTMAQRAEILGIRVNRSVSLLIHWDRSCGILADSLCPCQALSSVPSLLGLFEKAVGDSIPGYFSN